MSSGHGPPGGLDQMQRWRRAPAVRGSAWEARPASTAVAVAVLAVIGAFFVNACNPKPPPLPPSQYAGCTLARPGTTTTTLAFAGDLTYRGTPNEDASNRVEVVGDSIAIRVLGIGGGAERIRADYLLNYQARAGRTFDEMLPDLHAVLAQPPELRPRGLLIELGTNDVNKCLDGTEGRRSWRTGIAAAVAAIAAADIECVVLTTVNPTIEVLRARAPITAEMNAAMVATAAALGWEIMDLGYEMSEGPNAQEWAVLDSVTGGVGDGVHPTRDAGLVGTAGMMYDAFRDDCAIPPGDEPPTTTTTTTTTTTVPDTTAPDSTTEPEPMTESTSPTVAEPQQGR